MRARLDAARKESEKSDDAQVVVPAPAARWWYRRRRWPRRRWRPSSLCNRRRAAWRVCIEYYENEDFIDKCERAMNFRAKARPHDYKNRIEELTTTLKASKDCCDYVFQNGATFSKELERYEFNERQSYEALSAQVDALKTTSSTADSEVKALRAQIKSLKSEAGEKEVELMSEALTWRLRGTLKEEMSAIKTAMAGLEKELEKKTKDLDAAANKYAKLESSYTESTTRRALRRSPTVNSNATWRN